MAAKRVYYAREDAVIPKFTELKLHKQGDEKKRLWIDVKTSNVRARVLNQPIPEHDFINFKNMSANEILLNLANHEHMTNSELIGGLLELANHDTRHEFNWNIHPTTRECF